LPSEAKGRVATGSSGMKRRQGQATKERRKRAIFTFPQTKRNTKRRAGVVGKEERRREPCNKTKRKEEKKEKEDRKKREKENMHSHAPANQLQGYKREKKTSASEKKMNGFPKQG
jgi:hypothetical protein